MGLLTLVPWYYRAAAVVALIVAVLGFGYVKGLHHQKELDDEKFAEIRFTQDQQAIHAGQIAVDRAATISAVVDSYEDDRTRLGRYYADKLRDVQAANRAGAMPPGTLPAGTDARPADAGPDPAYVELQARCAETTLMLINLQKAARAVEEIK